MNLKRRFQAKLSNSFPARFAARFPYLSLCSVYLVNILKLEWIYSAEGAVFAGTGRMFPLWARNSQG
jgi:hypothetical protein